MNPAVLDLKQGDLFRLAGAAAGTRPRVYRVDQVVPGEGGSVLGYVISTESAIRAGTRHEYLYDAYSLAALRPEPA